MTRQPRVLDLFSGAGGAAQGYADAGFEVVGVDINPQKHFPFEFHRADVFEYVCRPGMVKRIRNEFDAIHASPPCQKYSITANLARAQGKQASEINLIPTTRYVLDVIGLPYVIENVHQARMFLINPTMLCGSSFGLKVRRHRMFESTFLIPSLPCDHKTQGRPVGVYGSKKDDIPQGGRTARTLAEGREAMGIDWMPWSKLVLSIPPAYTEYIGKFLWEVVKRKRHEHRYIDPWESGCGHVG